MGPQSPILQRRRGDRVLMRVPVEVRFANRQGQSVREESETSVVSRHGALLRLSAVPAPGATIDLRNKFTEQVEQFRVAWVSDEAREGHHDVGVELLQPRENFWGVRFSGRNPAA